MKFRINMPTPQRCQELGIKFEGLHNRTLMWLLGAAYMAGYSNHTFAVELVKPSFFIVVADEGTIRHVIGYLRPNGFTVQTHPEGREMVKSDMRTISLPLRGMGDSGGE